MKQTIKKSLIGGIVFSSTVLLIGITYASITQVTSGDTLTAEKFNEVIEATVPSGIVGAFNSSECPSGWIAADGTNGTPDLRGEFIRGLDNGRGVDTGRTLASNQDFAIETITGRVERLVSFADSFTSATHTDGAFTASSETTTSSSLSVSGAGDDHSFNINFDSSNIVNSDTETRPRNVALLYCIKE